MFKKHLTVVRNLILPTLDSVAHETAGQRWVPATDDAARAPAAEDDLIRGYRAFVPAGPRPHPDSFLSVALLRRNPNTGDVGANP